MCRSVIRAKPGEIDGYVPSSANSKVSVHLITRKQYGCTKQLIFAHHQSICFAKIHRGCF